MVYTRGAKAAAIRLQSWARLSLAQCRCKTAAARQIQSWIRARLHARSVEIDRLAEAGDYDGVVEALEARRADGINLTDAPWFSPKGVEDTATFKDKEEDLPCHGGKGVESSEDGKDGGSFDLPFYDAVDPIQIVLGLDNDNNNVSTDRFFIHDGDKLEVRQEHDLTDNLALEGLTLHDLNVFGALGTNDVHSINGIKVSPLSINSANINVSPLSINSASINVSPLSINSARDAMNSVTDFLLEEKDPEVQAIIEEATALADAEFQSDLQRTSERLAASGGLWVASPEKVALARAARIGWAVSGAVQLIQRTRTGRPEDSANRQSLPDDSANS